MLNNIYSPASAMAAHERVIEIIANNLANINTTAFKEDEIAFSALESNPWPNYKRLAPDTPLDRKRFDLFPFKGNEIHYTALGHVYRTKRNGPMILTKRPLDIAIEGQGYLGVQKGDHVFYTRAGHLLVNSAGILVTPDGDPIIGEQGLIGNLDQSAQIHISEDGQIWQNDQLIDRLLVFTPMNDAHMERLGDQLFAYTGPTEDLTQNGANLIKQGYLEGSNVNPVHNLVRLIAAQRQYESAAQASKTQDRLMEINANQIHNIRT